MNFIVDKYYLIGHTLSNTHERSFSSNNQKADIVAFQDEVWHKNESGYRLLPNKDMMTFDLYHHEMLQPFMKWTENLPTFQRILEQTIEYKTECEKRWLNEYEITSKYIEEITGLMIKNK